LNDAPYTLSRDPGAEARIADDLDRVGRGLADALGDALLGLLLVGGYARGEGSVVAHGDGLGPYNDYDFVAVVRGRPAALRARLAHFSEAWGRKLGVDVDVWPVDLAGLHGAPETLFWLDVALGGLRVVVGDGALADRLRRLVPRQMSVDRDLRRARHGHKAVLACGDARLLAADHYRPTLAERVVALRGLEGAPGVDSILVRAYEDAVSFRARPDAWRPPGVDGLDDWYARIRDAVGRWHLGYEAWRRGTPEDPVAFATWRGRVYGRLPDVRAGGASVAAVRAALRGVAPLTPWVGHPRERLARASVALAYAPSRPEGRAAAARLLGLGAAHHNDDARLHARLSALALRGG
jgi:hypothetical protein